MVFTRPTLLIALAFFMFGCPSAPDPEPVQVEGDEAGECSDEADNDSDGLFDCDDEGCQGSPACKEDDSQTDGSGDGNTNGAAADAGSADGSGDGAADGSSTENWAMQEVPMALPTETPTGGPRDMKKTPETATARWTAMSMETPTARWTEAPTARQTGTPTARQTETPTARQTEALTAGATTMAFRITRVR